MHYPNLIIDRNGIKWAHFNISDINIRQEGPFVVCNDVPVEMVSIYECLTIALFD